LAIKQVCMVGWANDRYQHKDETGRSRPGWDAALTQAARGKMPKDSDCFQSSSGKSNAESIFMQTPVV
jgi:hypothetical protein